MYILERASSLAILARPRLFSSLLKEITQSFACCCCCCCLSLSFFFFFLSFFFCFFPLQDCYRSLYCQLCLSVCLLCLSVCQSVLGQKVFQVMTSATVSKWASDSEQNNPSKLRSTVFSWGWFGADSAVYFVLLCVSAARVKSSNFLTANHCVNVTFEKGEKESINFWVLRNARDVAVCIFQVFLGYFFSHVTSSQCIVSPYSRLFKILYWGRQFIQ